MRRLPPLSAVRVFECAARHQNFTAAAAELGMSQAAVSYQIRLLEERLGVPLFVRSRGRVLLSDAGRRAAPLVSAGFDHLADAFSSILADDQGVLTVSTTQTFATNWLAPRLGAFNVAQPALAVRLSTENRMVDFAREEVDVGIRSKSGPPDWPGLKSLFLFRLHSAPMCSPAFAERYALKAPADLLAVPRLSPDDSWWVDWFACAGVPLPEAARHGGIRFDAQAMEGNAVIMGAGAAMLTPMFWRRDINRGQLVQPFERICLDRTSYYLVFPEYKRNHAKIAAFRNWLLAEIQACAAEERPEIFIPAEPE